RTMHSYSRSKILATTTRSHWCYPRVNCLGSRFVFFTDPRTTQIYTLSLHDALPILVCAKSSYHSPTAWNGSGVRRQTMSSTAPRSEEHTSELQSLAYLVCRLLLEKKKIARRAQAA